VIAMAGSIKKTAWYPHAPVRVWMALTDSDALARWLMPNDFEPRVGHMFTMQTKPAPGFDGIVRCEVLELDEPRMMAWRWLGGGIETVVRFELEAEREGTRLRLVQSGFRGVRQRMVGMILARGWTKMLAGSLRGEIEQS
jgi:uncharacterized protein YndB with AHSA1/START domain